MRDTRHFLVLSYRDFGEHLIRSSEPFTFGHLYNIIYNDMEEKLGEEDFNLQRALIYTRDRRRMDIGEEDELINTNVVFIIIIDDNANMLRIAESEPLEDMTVWPWRGEMPHVERAE
jgi:hypothetical protein